MEISRTHGVNFTNILWAAFAPKSFCQKITNPNCKCLKAVQRTLVWLLISTILYKQLFHAKVLCAPFMCLQFGLVIFWQKDFGTKAAHIMLVKLTHAWLILFTHLTCQVQFGRSHCLRCFRPESVSVCHLWKMVPPSDDVIKLFFPSPLTLGKNKLVRLTLASLLGESKMNRLGRSIPK
jgi:hypothetical protein